MSVTTLADAKTHLNITSTTDDPEIQDFIDRAEAAIEGRCGYLSSTSVTERVDGGAVLLLSHPPVISLTSVTPVNGTALTVSNLHVYSSGVVEAEDGTPFSTSRYDVVYTAGRASVPANLTLGILELTRHLWETQRVSGRAGPGRSQQMANTIPGANYTWPYRVTELIAEFEQGF